MRVFAAAGVMQLTVMWCRVSSFPNIQVHDVAGKQADPAGTPAPPPRSSPSSACRQGQPDQHTHFEVSTSGFARSCVNSGNFMSVTQTDLDAPERQVRLRLPLSF